MESVTDKPGRSSVPAYLQLFRLPNVFTAIADVAMGYLFLRPSLDPVPVFMTLVLASCLLYTAGMVLNDLFDIRQDRQERPERPLPSGRVSTATARILGCGMLGGGVLAAILADLLKADGSDTIWQSGTIAAVLAVCIVLYDGVLKTTWLGPVVMGSCRMLNVLLGMSGGVSAADGPRLFAVFDSAGLIVALGLGVYVAGVTWFARSEARESHRGVLVFGLAVIVAGLALLASFPRFGTYATGTAQLVFSSSIVWPLLLVLLGFSIVRRCLVAIASPSPGRVQVAVKQCILSIIVLDAAVCLAVRSPVWWSVAILALLAPMLLLGRWVYST